MSTVIKSEEMIAFAKELWPINRSITGEGLRETLRRIKEMLPVMAIHSIPSGTPCFDWVIPPEWNVRDAYILTPDKKKICCFMENNLHLVGYSEPMDCDISYNDLCNHLYSLPEQPHAIPYITSYYSRRWGFCLSHNQLEKLSKTGTYRVYIDSELKHGELNYGELLIPGETKDEILLSTYVCHPSMANNELSGPVVTTFLARWLSSLKHRKYSYRIVFIPETIGSIAYISKNLENLRERVVAGYVLTCIGDERTYSYLASRLGNTLSDRVAKHVLQHIAPDFKSYSFLERGSDERQYCSPGVDLPIASIMRSKYSTYPEYHTSLDNFDLVTARGLEGGFNAVKTCLEVMEGNKIYKSNFICEPQLGKRGLYPTVSTKLSKSLVADMMNVIAFSDGNTDLLSIAELTHLPFKSVKAIADQLEQHQVLVSY